MKKMGSTKGFSIMICFGSYAKFYFKRGHSSLRFCLGWVAITFYGYDFEVLNAMSMKKAIIDAHTQGQILSINVIQEHFKNADWTLLNKEIRNSKDGEQDEESIKYYNETFVNSK